MRINELTDSHVKFIVSIVLFALATIVFTANAEQKLDSPRNNSNAGALVFSNATTSVPQPPPEASKASISSLVPIVSEQKLTDAGKITRDLANGTVKVIVNLSPPQELSRTDFALKVSLENLRPQIRTHLINWFLYFYR